MEKIGTFLKADSNTTSNLQWLILVQSRVQREASALSTSMEKDSEVIIHWLSWAVR